jgi:hypothetical protein
MRTSFLMYDAMSFSMLYFSSACGERQAQVVVRPHTTVRACRFPTTQTLPSKSSRHALRWDPTAPEDAQRRQCASGAPRGGAVRCFPGVDYHTEPSDARTPGGSPSAGVPMTLLITLRAEVAALCDSGRSPPAGGCFGSSRGGPNCNRAPGRHRVCGVAGVHGPVRGVLSHREQGQRTLKPAATAHGLPPSRLWHKVPRRAPRPLPAQRGVAHGRGGTARTWVAQSMASCCISSLTSECAARGRAPASVPGPAWTQAAGTHCPHS